MPIYYLWRVSFNRSFCTVSPEDVPTRCSRKSRAQTLLPIRYLRITFGTIWTICGWLHVYKAYAYLVKKKTQNCCSKIILQVKCEVIVKKLHRMWATRDMEQCLSDFTAYDFARASAGRRPYTREKILVLWTCRLLDGSIKPK